MKMNVRTNRSLHFACTSSVLALGILSAAWANAEPQAGTIWTEPLTGMKFAYIPAGCFLMGSDSGSSFERPVHQVCLKPYYLAVNEVNQAQFEKITGRNPSHSRGVDLPVDSVNWLVARDMATKFSVTTGALFRLPSEAEWEYACRAGGKHALYCGEGRVQDLAWYSGNSGDDAAAVGTRQPNAWGLFDMSGNVWEWTQDCWHESYTGAPIDGSSWVSGGQCDGRVARGGSWGTGANNLRASARNWNSAGSDFTDTGFRLVRVAPAETPAAQ